MRIIAHRGASGYAPENTESAIRLAAAQGASWIEFDVRTSKDDIALLMHDSKVNRTSNGRGKVIHKTFSELSLLDCGSWYDEKYIDERVLSFDNLIALAKELDLFMQVELKPDIGYENNLISAIIDSIAKENMLQQCLFSSFNHDALAKLKNQLPDANTAVLVEQIQPSCYEALRKCGSDTIHFWLKKMNESALQKLHDDGITTRCFTVNDIDTAMYLKSLGVSAIFTDFPDKMLFLEKTN